jgi:Protein of unknown function (DUF2628)
MTLYSVFDRANAAPEPVAVPDRFSWFAAILPPLYMLRHGLWLALLGFFVAIVALSFLSLVVGDGASFWLYVLGAVLFGFEAGTLRRAKLWRRGLSYRTDIIASRPDLAEVEWLKGRR